MVDKLTIIKGGKLIDPSQDIDDIFDILIEDGKVKELIKTGEDRAGDIVDAVGMIVVPGLIDMHTHLREPGFEYKETIESGCRAGAAGGFTTLVAMANTSPVNDNASVTEFILKKAREEGVVNVLPVGAVTKGMKGEGITEMGELKRAGVAALSDDGLPVMNSEVMRRALEYSRAFDLPIISHAEDYHLSFSGVMHEGRVSARLGLRGIPREAEEVMVARDIALAALTGGRVHIAHVSSKGSVELIRDAKKRGVNVTAEVTPHHLNLTEEEVVGYQTNAKVNPPLREVKDIEALKQGLVDGTIDVIATDHAPHSSVEKDVEIEQAACGISGLETALSLSLRLVHDEVLSISELISRFTVNPSKILEIDAGTFKAGSVADLTIIDMDKEWTVDPAVFRSKGKNTPFAGWRLKGKVVKTMVGGEIVYG
ncbi:MAG: dihydroorotase [Thermodesulfobacteriota bacterium]